MNLSSRFIRIISALGLAFCLSLGLSSASFEAAWAADPTPAASGPVDLNTASESALQALPGVGPATSKAIVAARPFSSVEDLAKVKGIGPAKLAALRNLVTVSGSKAAAPAAPATAPIAPAPVVPKVAPAPAAAAPTAAVTHAAATAKTKLAPGQKVNLNTGSLAELEALPGIGPVKAQKIIAGRPYAKPEDVTKVSGIKAGIFAKIKDSITVQ